MELVLIKVIPNRKEKYCLFSHMFQSYIAFFIYASVGETHYFV